MIVFDKINERITAGNSAIKVKKYQNLIYSFIFLKIPSGIILMMNMMSLHMANT